MTPTTGKYPVVWYQHIDDLVLRQETIKTRKKYKYSRVDSSKRNYNCTMSCIIRLTITFILYTLVCVTWIQGHVIAKIIPYSYMCSTSLVCVWHQCDVQTSFLRYVLIDFLPCVCVCVLQSLRGQLQLHCCAPLFLAFLAEPRPSHGISSFCFQPDHGFMARSSPIMTPSMVGYLPAK